MFNGSLIIEAIVRDISERKKGAKLLEVEEYCFKRIA